MKAAGTIKETRHGFHVAVNHITGAMSRGKILILADFVATDLLGGKRYHLNISGLWPVSRPRHTGHGRETGPSFPKFLRRYGKSS